MKFKFSFLQIILISKLIILSLSKSKKKKDKKNNISNTLPNGRPTPEFARPDYIIPELFCETCRAIVNEALKELRTKRKESDVYNYLSNVCEESKYTTYEFIPQDIKRTCGVFMGVYEDEIVKLLTKRKIDAKNEDIIYNFCDEYTQVCKGVDVNYDKVYTKINGNANIDGMPLTIDVHKENEKSKDKNDSSKKNKSHIFKKIKNKRKIKTKRNTINETDL